MKLSPFSNPRLRNILIVAGSLLIVAGIAAGTAFMMKQFTPVKIGGESASNRQSSQTPQQKAEELLKKGDYAGAKAQYELALKEYKSSNNATAANDVEIQLQIIEATTTKAEKAPQNTDRNRVIMGPKPQ